MPFTSVIISIHKLSFIVTRPFGVDRMPTRIRFQSVERNIGINRKAVVVYQLPPLRVVCSIDKGCIVLKENLSYEIALYGKPDFSSIVYKMFPVNCTSGECLS